MSIRISRIKDSDIPGAITAVQEAFAEDPYKLWIYNDPAKLSLDRNRVSLGIRCRGMRNALFYVAKDESAADPDKVLGVAMWMPPKPARSKDTWGEWFESWRLWFSKYAYCFFVLKHHKSGGNANEEFVTTRANSTPNWLVCQWQGRLCRYWIWKETQAEAQAKIWTDEKGYYFLNIMVVLPGEQGKGIGRALVEEVTKMADAEEGSAT
ncbi:hypothetical protein B0O99DRAFT_682164 [Bisporella sp. PMI_857]|nr:hypothetical protein B0O99DRAFT_682828 [Bisporella sp. PMI_857]KAH8600479.1 hypothetical protein B0O99DRAFT_682164 [Bisporella sp. PMI_857]